MNETLSSIEFNTRIPTDDALEIIANEGALAIHNFLPANELSQAGQSLLGESMIIDETTTEKVHRRHGLVQYGYSQNRPWPQQVGRMTSPPEAVFRAVRAIDEYVTNTGKSRWFPNEIMGHRYDPGDFIAKHRDFASALGYVAVLTLEGSQEFHIQRDSGEMASIMLEPGTLTLMRGYQPGSDKQRPYHSVFPAKQRRLALSLRHMRPLTWDD